MKNEAEMVELKKQGAGFGLASCDACHTRHTFSKKEAQQPQVCQTCHFQKGDHAVVTPWGFLAVRLPMPEDQQWAADRATILEGLRVLDPDGKPTARLETVKAAAAELREKVKGPKQPMQDSRTRTSARVLARANEHPSCRRHIGHATPARTTRRRRNRRRPNCQPRNSPAYRVRARRVAIDNP